MTWKQNLEKKILFARDVFMLMHRVMVGGPTQQSYRCVPLKKPYFENRDRKVQKCFS